MRKTFLEIFRRANFELNPPSVTTLSSFPTKSHKLSRSTAWQNTVSKRLLGDRRNRVSEYVTRRTILNERNFIEFLWQNDITVVTYLPVVSYFSPSSNSFVCLPSALATCIHNGTWDTSRNIRSIYVCIILTTLRKLAGAKDIRGSQFIFSADSSKGNFSWRWWWWWWYVVLEDEGESCDAPLHIFPKACLSYSRKFFLFLILGSDHSLVW